MSDAVLENLREIIQRDVAQRGLRTDPRENLITACAGDFAQACHSLARARSPVVAIVTGFYIPNAGAAETDGPIGAVFLARALVRLGARVTLAAEEFCYRPLALALEACGLSDEVLVVLLPSPRAHSLAKDDPCLMLLKGITHLIAVERPGPARRKASGQEGDYHTMSGRIITEHMYPTHTWFEEARRQEPRVTTIGIGDGGNEIGMGKIPPEIIARNVPNGNLVACRVPTDFNIVCGVSNWGAYGLAAGIWRLRGLPFDAKLFNADAERRLWEPVLQQAVLVDGLTGQRTLTVDGLSWEDYTRPLGEIADLLRRQG